MANRKLGKYDIRDRLGRGGMAEVYRAYHSNLDRYVAIKVLHAFLADDPEFKTRFEREAQNVAKLRHPNIVQVYDFDYDDESESYYMVMEMVDGPTLKDWLAELTKRGELLTREESIRIIREAAGALAYAHSRSMIHRDVKPANLMLDHDMRVVLTDFGIAKIVTGVQLTASGGMVGTPAYMAPEQGLGEAGDERSDLYSLGVIFFQLMTGELPYDADTPLAIILKHLNAPIPSVHDIKPDLPGAFDQIIQKAMAKEPQDRYQSANELIEDLNRLERGEAVNAAPVRENVATSQPIVDMDTVKVANPIAMANETVPSAPTTVNRDSSQRRVPWWGWGGILVGLIASVFLIGAASGLFAQSSGTPTPTIDGLPTNAALSFTATSMVIATQPDVLANSLTPSQIPPTVPTLTPTPSKVPSFTFTPPATSTLTPTLTPTPATPVAQPKSGSGIIMRTGPGNQYPKVTTIESVDTVSIIGVSKDFTWIKVRTTTNVPGWIQMQSVNVYGDFGIVPIAEGPTLTPTYTPTITPTPTQSLTPTFTLTPSPSYTPTQDVTLTLAVAATVAAQQTATINACQWDYAIVAENPPDAVRHLPGQGDATPQPVRAAKPYTREITLQNTGTCVWDLNTALKFIAGTGENFNAGPRIFLRDAQGQPVRVDVGSTIVLVFEGTTPSKGALYDGQWELVTPGQLRIGEPMQISIRTYEGG